MHPSTGRETHPEHVRIYLQLTRLLDGISDHHPEVSAPMRLTLLRARRDGTLAALDQGRFRALVAATGHVARSARS